MHGPRQVHRGVDRVPFPTVSTDSADHVVDKRDDARFVYIFYYNGTRPPPSDVIERIARILERAGLSYALPSSLSSRELAALRRDHEKIHVGRAILGEQAGIFVDVVARQAAVSPGVTEDGAKTVVALRCEHVLEIAAREPL